MIGKTISHYRILGQVGEGGMGVVYVAEDTRLGRRVAIKFPHAGRDESHYRSRFLREARAVSLLTHKNIAAVFDYGETEEGQPFIVMELVTGQTLGDMLAAEGLSVARSVEIIREVAEALSEAHRRGIVHRDIKPSNVIVNERGEVKVLDFGLAKQLHEDDPASGPDGRLLTMTRTRSDVVIGTPLYLSPEQARGAKVDGRSDLFALGALLYECVAGRPAFSGSNVIEIGAQVLHFDPLPPSRFNPRVTADLDRLTLTALAKKPEDRYQSAREMAADLARLRPRLPNDTVRTRRLSTDDNLARPSALTTVALNLRRPRFSPLALLATLLVAFFAIWGYGYLREPAAHKPAAEAVRLYEEGVAGLREGAYYKASKLLEQAVEADQKFAVAHARLGDALMGMDYLDRAREEALSALQLTQGRPSAARGDALYIEAVTSTVLGHYPEAVRAYSELVKLNPSQPEAHLDLGRAYELNNETVKAIDSYTEASRLRPGYAAALLRLGALHARQKKLSAAAKEFQDALKLYAESGNKEGEAEAHFQYGRLLVELRKQAEARPELQSALDLARETDNRYQVVQALLQLINTEQNTERARDYAREALDIAQANRMNALIMLGYARLGQVYFTENRDADAQLALEQALRMAGAEKVRRVEALAFLFLGQIRYRQGDRDEAERMVTTARDFYQQGGYRKEADQAAAVLSRFRRLRGDFAGALQAFEQQLRHADPAADPHQVGVLHRECGAVLLFQGNYVEALKHFDEALKTFNSLEDKAYAAYCQLVRGTALWQLGRREEAAAALREAAEFAANPSNPKNPLKDLLMNVRLQEAQMALSGLRFAEARAAGRQALELAQGRVGPPVDVEAVADSVLGLSETLSGNRARGRELCEQAVAVALKINDPWLVSISRLALAQALLEGGDAEGARAAALEAVDFFARSGSDSCEWQAQAVAGLAGLRAGSEPEAARASLSRAHELLSRLENSWGADALGTYLSRPDLQSLRRRMGGASPTSR
jgi:tetratricopeptide (TPR) repeat protein/tRNA A-37 threonylcarbamoyl transferase component Bud32